MIKLPLQGDGRMKLLPACTITGTEIAVRREVARKMVAHFDKAGCSNHSSMGSTLWVLIAHCAERGIPYELTAVPGLGYRIERREESV